MNKDEKRRCLAAWLLALAAVCAWPASAAAQDYFPPPPPGSYAPAPVAPAFSPQELDQMLAPVALYPDALLSQLLMASTYPLEVVEAARWSRTHPGPRGDAAVRAAQGMNWDPSVISLLAFPQILDMMDRNLEWTQRLGDAFLSQEAQLMDTVQALRQRAYAAGTLRSDERMRVYVRGSYLVIEPTYPSLLYVPHYDPTLVYGQWWWPAYPPVYWAPWQGYYARPGYAAGFYWGSGIRLGIGFFFGSFDWNVRQARVNNVHNYYYNRPSLRRDAPPAMVAAPGAWQHDPVHRRGIRYPEPGTRERFGAGTPPQASRGVQTPAPPAVRAPQPQISASPIGRAPQPQISAQPIVRAPQPQTSAPPVVLGPQPRPTAGPARDAVAPNEPRITRNAPAERAAPPPVATTPRTPPQERQFRERSEPNAGARGDHGTPREQGRGGERGERSKG